MAYDLQLAQINTNFRGLYQTNTACGFPANTNFSTLLMSYWMCGPMGTGIWPEFNAAGFFTFDPGAANNITLTNQGLGSGHFYRGTWTLSSPGTRTHFLLSVDTHAQVVQLYVNDKPVSVTGTWTGTPPYNFNVAALFNIWQWIVSGVIAVSGHNPGLGDAWIANPPAFVDLSVIANRRKFINHDLTPVDLGNTGTNPFGTQPAIYMSVRPGGAATDILINRGVGGGSWSYDQDPPTVQAPTSCPPPPFSSLAMDNLLAFAAVRSSNLVFLEWSDDRGHSWSNPVSQPIGDRGEYLTSASWNRLGYARDRVFSIEWSVPVATALIGAYITVDTSAKS